MQQKDKIGEYGLELFVFTMGVVAITYWIFQCVTVITWTTRLMNDSDLEIYKHFIWNSAQFAARALSTFSQIQMFTLTTEDTVCEEFQNDNTVYALVPFYMLSLLSIFVNSVIGSYSGRIDKWMECAPFNIFFVGLHNIGAAFHLGFCLHLFVHFLLLNNKLRISRPEFPQSRRRGSKTSNDEVNIVNVNHE